MRNKSAAMRRDKLSSHTWLGFLKSVSFDGLGTGGRGEGTFSFCFKFTKENILNEYSRNSKVTLFKNTCNID